MVLKHHHYHHRSLSEAWGPMNPANPFLSNFLINQYSTKFELNLRFAEGEKSQEHFFYINFTRCFIEAA